MRGRAAFLLAAFAFATPACACGNEEEVSRLGESGPHATSTLAAPTSFSETRSAILSAADSGDYAALRPLIEADTFLSDFGFGEESDPVGRWEEMGSRPLETMAVLLRMKHVVRETNEGTLYQWPSYDSDSDPGDLTLKDRDRFKTVMSQAELERMITDEYGYTGPRLGILEDGTWWFFILEGGP
jgi:hypothetical protein